MLWENMRFVGFSPTMKCNIIQFELLTTSNDKIYSVCKQARIAVRSYGDTHDSSLKYANLCLFVTVGNKLNQHKSHILISRYIKSMFYWPLWVVALVVLMSSKVSAGCSRSAGCYG